MAIFRKLSLYNDFKLRSIRVSYYCRYPVIGSLNKPCRDWALGHVWAEHNILQDLPKPSPCSHHWFSDGDKKNYKKEIEFVREICAVTDHISLLWFEILLFGKLYLSDLIFTITKNALHKTTDIILFYGMLKADYSHLISLTMVYVYHIFSLHLWNTNSLNFAATDIRR